MGDIALHLRIEALTKQVERIADHLTEAPGEDLNAALAGNVAGFADWLQEALECEDQFARAQKLRELYGRARQMQKNYEEQIEN